MAKHKGDTCSAEFSEKHIKDSGCLTIGECASFALGGRYSPSITTNGEYLRLLTSIAIYDDGVMVFMNVITMLMYGYMCEHYYGVRRYLLVFTAAAVSGNALSMIVYRTRVYAGASAGVYGLIGMNAVYITQHLKYFGESRSLQAKNFIWIIASGFLLFSLDVDADIAGLPLAFMVGVAITSLGVRFINRVAIAAKRIVVAATAVTVIAVLWALATQKSD